MAESDVLRVDRGEYGLLPSKPATKQMFLPPLFKPSNVVRSILDLVHIASGEVMKAIALVVPFVCMAASNVNAQDYSAYLPICEKNVSAEYRSGFLSYIYLSPLVDFMSQRANQVTACDLTTERYLTDGGDVFVPAEQYFQNQLFYSADISSCLNPVVRPNTDSLYVVGQFDLSKGPVLITHPQMYFPPDPGELPQEASFSLQFVDPWTNSFFHVSPWGTGPTSSTEGSVDPRNPRSGDFSAREYFLYWGDADYADELESDENIDPSSLIESTYQLAWMLGRITVPYDDLEKTRNLCRQLTSTSYEWVQGQGLVEIPLSIATWPANPCQLPACMDGNQAYKVDCAAIQAPGFDVIEYLDIAAQALVYAPIPPDLIDQYYAQQLSAIGVDAVTLGPSNAGLSPEKLDEITAGFQCAVDLFCGTPSLPNPIDPATLGFTVDPNRSEWIVPPKDVGDYGSKAVLRAYIAQLGLAADTRTYEFYPTATTYSNASADDPNLISVTGGDRPESIEYVLIMDASIDRFCSDWSLTMYVTDSSESEAQILCSTYNSSCDADGNFCVKAVGTSHRTWLGEEGAVKTVDDNGRSCYRVLISPNPPPAEDTTLNWLPSPNAPGQISDIDDEAMFQVTLRIFNGKFGPLQQHIPGWQLPCILKLEDADPYPGCTGCLETVPGCLGDLAADGVVDSIDLALIYSAWGDCPDCIEDLDGNGTVNARDLGMLLRAWGPCN